MQRLQDNHKVPVTLVSGDLALKNELMPVMPGWNLSARKKESVNLLQKLLSALFGMNLRRAIPIAQE
jgi:D-aminopeptidase